MDCTLHDSFKSGQWSARQAYSGEELPTIGELVLERMDTLRDEFPYADGEELEAHACAWAKGWMEAARSARAHYELQHARELLAELASVATELSAVWEASHAGVGLALERSYPEHLGDFREVVANLQAWRDVL